MKNFSTKDSVLCTQALEPETFYKVIYSRTNKLMASKLYQLSPADI